MENKEIMIPYIVHEGVLARLERIIKRQWILCIIMFLALVITNSAWIYYESQWQVTTTEVTTSNEISQDLDARDGGNAIINGDIDIHGEDKTEDKNQ